MDAEWVKPIIMEIDQIPYRVFLDTSVVNFILDYGEYIHNGVPYPEDASERIISDIEALYNIFLTGQRAPWQLAVSPSTFKEVISTNAPSRRFHLENWFLEIWDYWRNIVASNYDLTNSIEAEDIRINLLASGVLDILSDIGDRLLICDAIVYKAQCFCTRDWNTILKYREHLKNLPIKIVTPKEWWFLIRPYFDLTLDYGYEFI